MENVKILGFTGSLRKGSYNLAALKATQELLPAGASLEIADLSGIPFYNQDEADQGFPQVVLDFKEKVENADAVLICTPEYNYSIPPVLKNALDWASRGNKTPFAGKTTGIMSVSTGMMGGGRVQYHLRQVCVMLDMRVINKPEVFVSFAASKFSPDGRLQDADTREHIRKLLAALVAAVQNNKK